METGAPVRVLAGYLGRVTVSVPWAALLTDSCKVEIGELSLTVAPHLHLGGGAEEEECGKTPHSGVACHVTVLLQVLTHCSV